MSEQPGPGGPNRKPDTDDIAGQIEKATRSMELRDPDAGLPSPTGSSTGSSRLSA